MVVTPIQLELIDKILDAYVKEHGENSSVRDWKISNIISDRLGFEISFNQNNDKFCVFDGASKVVFTLPQSDFVIKIAEDEDYNETGMELEIYKSAVEQGIEKFFPETRFLRKMGNRDIVLQQKIDYQADRVPKNIRTKWERMVKLTMSYKKGQKSSGKFYKGGHYDRHLDDLWIAMAILKHGKRAVSKLEKFTWQHKINDLHESNVGYLNGYPILLDFSGYHQ